MDVNIIFDEESSTMFIEQPSGQKATSNRGRKRRLDHLSWEEKVQRK